MPLGIPHEEEAGLVPQGTLDPLGLVRGIDQEDNGEGPEGQPIRKSPGMEAEVRHYDIGGVIAHQGLDLGYGQGKEGFPKVRPGEDTGQGPALGLGIYGKKDPGATHGLVPAWAG